MVVDILISLKLDRFYEKLTYHKIFENWLKIIVVDILSELKPSKLYQELSNHKIFQSSFNFSV